AGAANRRSPNRRRRRGAVPRTCGDGSEREAEADRPTPAADRQLRVEQIAGHRIPGLEEDLRVVHAPLLVELARGARLEEVELERDLARAARPDAPAVGLGDAAGAGVPVDDVEADLRREHDRDAQLAS